MSDKPTPEIWQFHDYPSRGISPMDDGGDYPVYIERNNTRHIICEVICKTRENNSEPARGNARLIVAACNAFKQDLELAEALQGGGIAEMVEALREYLDWHETNFVLPSGNFEDPDQHALAKAARAILAKLPKPETEI